MKRTLAALLFLFSLSAFASTASPALKAEQHKATYTIVTQAPGSFVGAGCSASAISEHVLITSAHCRIDGGVVYLNQTVRPYSHPLKVADRVYDGSDHMLVVLPGVTFKHFVAYDPDNYKSASVGERYYLWGNPGMIPDQYREGYISGKSTPANDEEVMLSQTIMLISGPVVGGDSGSAIFAEDGRIIGTLTWGIHGGLFGGFYPLNFTKQQVLQAEGRGTFVYGTEEPSPVQAPGLTTVNVPKQDNSPFYLIALILALPVIGKVLVFLCGGVRCVAWYGWQMLKFSGRAARSIFLAAKAI
jgi:hypothetical protein